MITFPLIYEFHGDVFVRNAISKNPFSIIHCNIGSLSANYDNMITLLAGLQHNFSIIGLSETRIKVDRDQLINTAIPGNTFFPSQQFMKLVEWSYIRDEIPHRIVFYFIFIN